MKTLMVLIVALVGFASNAESIHFSASQQERQCLDLLARSLDRMYYDHARDRYIVIGGAPNMNHYFNLGYAYDSLTQLPGSAKLDMQKSELNVFMSRNCAAGQGGAGDCAIRHVVPLTHEHIATFIEMEVTTMRIEAERDKNLDIIAKGRIAEAVSVCGGFTEMADSELKQLANHL